MSLNFSELKRCFSGRVFGFLCMVLLCYLGFKAMLFEPKYECAMTLQAPGNSELLGIKPTQLLRYRISLIIEQPVFLEEKGNFLKFSSNSVVKETACSQLVEIKAYVTNHVNGQIPAYTKALRRESKFLEDFFSAVLEKRPSITKEIDSRPDSDKQFHELIRRKIAVDGILENPSLLGFKVISDVRIIAPSELYFDIRKKLPFIILFLVYSTLISFLVGYFSLTLKIRERFFDEAR